MLCNACKLGHPGGGVYVERVRVRFLHGKRLSVCLQVVPHALRFGVLWSQDAPPDPERVLERPYRLAHFLAR